MQTALAEFIRSTDAGREADSILRSCVHCGFCTATCPTYQLLGDELDGPRGRIYLIKQVLEGYAATATTQRHLDRCLTCRSCETTCPSGVRYGRLLDIGRRVVEQQVGRSLRERIVRAALLGLVPYSKRFGALLRLGQIVRPLMPAALRRQVPALQTPGVRPQVRHARRMLVLDGCVQGTATPATNAAAARAFDRLGISLVSAPAAGCCGAASHHLNAHAQASALVKRNIDAWWPHIERGAEAILVAASGCAVMVKDYGVFMRDDAAYAEKAARVAALARDPSEVLSGEDLSPLSVSGNGMRIAFHSPCTLQHGQGLGGAVEAILSRLGFELTPVADAHMCCGSAGTYSILQPQLSQQLLQKKLAALQEGVPEMIVTANIGCQLHLQTHAGLPVRHWMELLDPLGH